MITDEIVEAIDMMIEVCGDAEHRKGMDSIREMLCDFDVTAWMAADEEEKESWIKRFFE